MRARCRTKCARGSADTFPDGFLCGPQRRVSEASCGASPPAFRTRGFRRVDIAPVNPLPDVSILYLQLERKNLFRAHCGKHRETRRSVISYCWHASPIRSRKGTEHDARMDESTSFRFDSRSIQQISRSAIVSITNAEGE